MKQPVVINDREVEILLSDFTKNLFSPSAMKGLLSELAHLGKFCILERTAKGKDVNNKFFAPYAPATVFFRQRKGRPTDKVDLFFTGRMFGSMTVKSTSSWARLYFPPSEAKKAVLHQLGVRVPERKFFGLNVSDMEKIGEVVDKRIEEVINGRK